MQSLKGIIQRAQGYCGHCSAFHDVCVNLYVVHAPVQTENVGDTTIIKGQAQRNPAYENLICQKFATLTLLIRR